MDKIVHISMVPPYQTQAQSLFIAECLEAGLQVEYWDISEIYASGVNRAYEAQICPVIRFQSSQQLEHALSQADISTTLFNLQIFLSFEYRAVFRLLAKYRCLTCLINSAYIPLARQPLAPKIVRYLKNPRLLAGVTLRVLGLQLYKSLYPIGPQAIMFTAGLKAAEAYPPSSTQIVRINSGDYEDYLRKKDSPHRVVANKYWVFIDDYLPFHPDLAILGLKHVEAAPYFEALRRFFDRLEAEWQTEIVIAAHPKSDYASDVFGARKLIKFRTNELIRDAELVIAHNSTAIGFAVTYRKPSVLIYDDEIERVSRGTIYNPKANILLLGETLGLPVLNISHLPADFRFSLPEVNGELYQKYKYNYLTWPETENTPSSKILISAVRALSSPASPLAASSST